MAFISSLESSVRSSFSYATAVTPAAAIAAMKSALRMGPPSIRVDSIQLLASLGVLFPANP